MAGIRSAGARTSRVSTAVEQRARPRRRGESVPTDDTPAVSLDPESVATTLPLLSLPARAPSLDAARQESCREAFIAIADQFTLDEHRMFGWQTLGEPSLLSEFLHDLAWFSGERFPGEILLVDADFRRKSLTRLLEQRDGVGLSELAGAGIHSPLGISRSDGQVAFLPAGRSSVRRDALDSISGSLTRLRSTFRINWLDLGDGQSSLAKACAPHCDAMFLIVPVGSTTSDAVREWALAARASGLRLGGSVAVHG